jgi:hypothetical protein
MHVLADEDRDAGAAAQGGEDGTKEPIPGSTLGQQPLHFRPQLAGDLEEGPEGTGRRQGVAGDDRDPRRGRRLRHEALDQRGLADPRLAAEEHQAAVARGGPPQELAEFVQVGGSLEQLHATTIAPGGGLSSDGGQPTERSAAAVSFVRVADWLADTPRARTRRSAIAALMAPPAYGQPEFASGINPGETKPRPARDCRCSPAATPTACRLHRIGGRARMSAHPQSR